MICLPAVDDPYRFRNFVVRRHAAPIDRSNTELNSPIGSSSCEIKNICSNLQGSTCSQAQDNLHAGRVKSKFRNLVNTGIHHSYCKDHYSKRYAQSYL